MRLLFGFFTEERSYPASMLSALAIEKGWDVHLEFFNNEDPDDKIKDRLIQLQPDLVALTFRTFERKRAFQVAKIVHSLGIKLVAGGAHPTYCPDDLMTSGYFDVVVVGDGMGVFCEILDTYKTLNRKLIKGRRHNDLSVYIKRYFSETQKKQIKDSKTVQILTTLGCPFNCHFCATDKEFIMFPVESIAEQLFKFKKEFDVGRINVFDETFTFNHKRIRKFREVLENYEISFGFTVHSRVDCFNEKIAKELVALGVEDICFGVESASPKLLNFLNKKTSIERAYRAAEICRKYHLPFKANFMFGIPTQDEEDYKANIDFVKKTKPDVTNYFSFTPYPGTQLFDYSQNNGYLQDNFSYDDYQDNLGDIRSLKGLLRSTRMLKKVDYEMAGEYMKKTREINDKHKKEFILKIAALADKKSWVLFGSGTYFYQVLEMISNQKWKNCLGYYDYHFEEFNSLLDNYDTPKYEWNQKKKT